MLALGCASAELHAELRSWRRVSIFCFLFEVAATFEAGNLGDFKTVRGGVIELREDAFRIYLRRVNQEAYRVINAGDKHSQDRDIEDCQHLE